MSEEANHALPMASEETEPRADWSPAPVLLIGLMALLVFGGMVYLNNHGGGFDARVYFPYKDFAELDAAQFHDPHEDFINHGRQLFMVNCSVCHQPSGMGVPGQFPPLVASDWVNFKTPNRIIRFVLCGFQGPLVLNGQPFATSAQMSAFRSSLSDDDIAAILSFVRSNKEWNNSASDVSPDLVKTIRAKVATHLNSFSPDEALKVSENE
jgi:mono/diheme cytochrome c family protein